LGTVIGHVDGFEGQYLVGWAIADPDVESCVIEAVDEDGHIVGRGRATRARADLRALGRGRTNFAFRIPMRLGGGRLLRVCAAGQELPGSPLPVGPGNWDGVLEIVGGRAAGWLTERAVASNTPWTLEICDAYGTVVGVADCSPDTSYHDAHFVPARFDAPLAQRCFGQGDTIFFARVDGKVFAQSRANLRLNGFLDFVSPERVNGWLLSPDAPDRDFDIEISRNGRRIATTRACRPREDLKALHPTAWRKGFDVALERNVGPSELCEISLHLAGSDVELFDGPFVIGGNAALIAAARDAVRLSHVAHDELNACARSVLQSAIGDFIRKHRSLSETVVLRGLRRGQSSSGATVIIPVYRGIDVTRECIESVLRHRATSPCRVVIVNDCSPEAGMAAMLAEFKRQPGVVLLTNETNLGFVKTVNRALADFVDGDAVLLNSDTRVFDGWLDEMMRVAYASPDIGTVTALSNNATLFSYPHQSLACSTLRDASWEELAGVARRENAGCFEDVPTGHGFCLLIKRDVLHRVGRLDERYGRGYGEENHLCCEAADLGYRSVAATGVLVEHREKISFGDERVTLWERNRPQLEAAFPEYTPQVMAYEAQDGLRKARWAFDRYRLAKAKEAGRGFGLVIRNWLGGGCDTAIRDLEGSIDPNLSRLLLSARADGFVTLSAEDPVLLANFAPDEEAQLFALLDASDIRLVVAHQLLGFSQAFVERFAGWVKGRASAYYLHDFYPLCPRVTLLDANDTFCGIPDIEICERCIKAGGAHEASRIRDVSVSTHRRLFNQVLANVGAVISPSANAERYVKKVFPDLGVHVVPHPQTLWKFPDKARDGSPNDIVLLGAIGPHKGSHALLDLASRARLTHPQLHFHVIGYTNIDDELLALGNVSITGEYEQASLMRLVEKTGGRFALFLHRWPETFSYTLTEAVACGLIPIVPDIGAPADRVRDAGYGAVYPFPSDAGQVLQVLHAMGASADKETPRRPVAASDFKVANIEATRRILQNITPHPIASGSKPAVAGRKSSPRRPALRKHTPSAADARKASA
jgi:GT2 family glycosyltransferase